ncbi:MAG: WD40 repeat domain-containing protein [Gemmataceae bacterium]
MRSFPLAFALLLPAAVSAAESARDRFGDPLPDGAIARLGSTNGREPNVTLSDVKGGKPTVSAALPDQSRVVEIMFSPDGRRVLVRTWSGAVRVLEGATGQTVRDLKPDSTGRRINSTAAFAPDGRSVALNDDRLCIRETASGKDRLQISPPPPSDRLNFSPNGRFLACNSHDGNDDSIRVYSTATGKLLVRWWGNQSASTALAFSPDSRLLASGGYDGTILLWKLPENEGLPPQLSQAETATSWQTLADDDAARANRALAGLTDAPAQAIPLIKERFRTVWSKPDAKQIARWIAELDDDAFKVREQAMRELSEAGFDAADALRRALANSPSAEAKRRMEDLLNRLNKGGDPERLRSLRAIEVLERIGTPQAKEVLWGLSRKPLSKELDDEIHASLRRMGERP